MKSKIFYTKPSITSLEVQYATDAALNGWGDNCYEYIKKFENKFKESIGVKFAISTSSCTGALHMGLAALEIKSGDEVIVADTNWIATIAPIIHLGAKPIFVDILSDTWCIDPCKVEKAITSKTRAIIAVHLYGNLCEMDELNVIGKKYGIPIIEDAAEAIGSIYKGKKAGSMGEFATFSFHGSKTITTGEGGMFVTNNEKLYETVLTYSNHGRHRNQKKQFWPEVIGFKYKMSNLQAAIGLAQIERVEELTLRKRQLLDYYRTAFSNYNEITLNPEPANGVNGAWMPTIVFDESAKLNLAQLKKHFAAESIDARPFFWPLSTLPMFKKNLNNHVAYGIYSRAINLPSYHDISIIELDRVIKIIKIELGNSKNT
jgi:perosamine synthetase